MYDSIYAVEIAKDHLMSSFVSDCREALESNANDPVFISNSEISNSGICSERAAPITRAAPVKSVNEVPSLICLETLNVDQLCKLLAHCELSAAQTCVRDQSLSGLMWYTFALLKIIVISLYYFFVRIRQDSGFICDIGE